MLFWEWHSNYITIYPDPQRGKLQVVVFAAANSKRSTFPLPKQIWHTCTSLAGSPCSFFMTHTHTLHASHTYTHRQVCWMTDKRVHSVHSTKRKQRRYIVSSLVSLVEKESDKRKLSRPRQNWPAPRCIWFNELIYWLSWQASWHQHTSPNFPHPRLIALMSCSPGWLTSP